MKIDGSVNAKIARDFDVRNYPSFVFVQGVYILNSILT